MKQFKAIFFDRDGTLTKNNTALIQERDAYLGEIIGKENFQLTPELFAKMFDEVSNEYLDSNDVTTMELEEAFWKKWYQLLLEENGVKQNVESLADNLYQKFPNHKMKELYPETLSVLEYFKKLGYKIGVISDTFPSLKKSLEAVEVADYFNAFICSSLVGVMKPDPKIFHAALEALGVTAEESLYVDDYDIEADGARQLGFTSFYLDRKLPGQKSEWTIASLDELINYVESD